MRWARGERQVWEELIQQWQQRLFYFVRRLVATEEDAWDVLQQTWLRVLCGIHKRKHHAMRPKDKEVAAANSDWPMISGDPHGADHKSELYYMFH